MNRELLKVLQINRILNTGNFLLTRYASRDSAGRNPEDVEALFLRKKYRRESLEKKRARLLYQSRKRGILENDLLLSTFAAKYLSNMTSEELKQYDNLINKPTNDWDIYYWATGVKPTPNEYNNKIMNLFKEHVKNKNRVMRIRQPDLFTEFYNLP